MQLLCSSFHKHPLLLLFYFNIIGNSKFFELKQKCHEKQAAGKS